MKEAPYSCQCSGIARRGLGSWVRMEKIIATVLHEAHRRQVEEAMDAIEEGPEKFYGSNADR